MTIYNGSNGSICFYYKGLLISSYPLTKNKTCQAYLNQGEEFETLAKQFSDDKSSSNKGGRLNPFKGGQLSSTEFENMA